MYVSSPNDWMKTRLEIKWNANLMQQCDEYSSFLSSTCFGRIRPSSRALEVKLQHMVLCTQSVDRWWSWEPLRRSCVRCGWCRAYEYLQIITLIPTSLDSAIRIKETSLGWRSNKIKKLYTFTVRIICQYCRFNYFSRISILLRYRVINSAL